MMRIFNSSLLKCQSKMTSRMCSSIDKSYFNSRIDISDEVQEALNTNKPIVSLESTIITHGMPYPVNLKTALEVEGIIRSENAIPATIAILNGRIKVGLSMDQIEFLAKPSDDSKAIKTVKTSRRDFPIVLSNCWNGGTTVAGTLIVSNLVGIKVFATGGIGGVHRNGHITMDVSADLMELGKTPIAVVSSGVKSILDIPRTLEYLETQGVLVGVYQNSDCQFPAFYTRTSGVKAPYNFNSALDVAKSIEILCDLKLDSGILVAVPIPEEFAMDEQIMTSAIETALKNAEILKIEGKEVTPYLLSAISKITAGRSLDANIALIKNNAKVAAKIAVEFSKFKKVTQSTNENHSSSRNCPIIIGGSIMDTCITVIDDDLKMDGATYNSNVQMSGGGVGRNITHVLCKLYGGSKFISAVGNDQYGRYLRSTLPNECTKYLITDKSLATANCSVILDKFGECKLIVGNMEIHNSIVPDLIIKNEEEFENAPIVILDANVPLNTMEVVLTMCLKYQKPVFFEPTDMNIAGKPFQLKSNLINAIKFISPNFYELRAIAKQLGFKSVETNSLEKLTKDEILTEIILLTRLIQNYADTITIIVTLGSIGIVVVRFNNEMMKFFTNDKKYIPIQETKRCRQIRFYPAPKINDIVNVSGAGDSFTSGFITAMLAGKKETICVNVGFKSAEMALKSNSCVPLKYFDQTHSCWNTEADFVQILE